MRIKRFIIEHNDKKLYDLNFDDIHDSDTEVNNGKTNCFTSIIIGENGAGKSYLLSQMSYFLLEYYNKMIKKETRKKSDQLKYDKYILVYELNLNEYKIVREHGEYHSKPYDNVSFLEKIIVISQTLDDKFYFNKSEYADENDWYFYGGDRSSANAIFLGTKEKNIINIISRNTNNKMIVNTLIDILNLFNFDRTVTIKYTPLFSQKDIKSLKSRITDEVNKIRKRKHNRNYDVENILDKYSLDFIQNQFIELFHTNKELQIDFNLIKNKEMEVDSQLLSILKFFTNIKLIKPTLIFSINKESFEYIKLSSGEKRILSAFIKISSSIKDNSIILIDEPETSLHPRWQQKFIPLIYSFYSTINSHFIIATHSHFMVSDLYPTSSSLIHIYLDVTRERKCETIDFSTYGWSAENILFTVFNLRTSRNRYFISEVEKLIKLIETDSDKLSVIQNYVDKFDFFTLDEKDPLNDILGIARNHIKNHKENE